MIKRLGLFVAGLTAGVSLSGFALAQPGTSDPNAPTGPAATPASGPTLTINSEGQATTGSSAATTPVPGAPGSDDARPTPQRLKLKDPNAAPPPSRLIWHDSTVMVDQSVNTETVGLGANYQSRNPSYQLWISARPRFYVYEDSQQRFNVNFRFDLYKELTNSDGDTQYRQNVFGDIWINGVYTRILQKKNGWATTLLLGPRFMVPTSLDSRANGMILTAGGGAGLMQAFPLNKGSEYFGSGRLVGTLFYTHPFVNSTTAHSSNVDRPRTQMDGRTGQSNQLSGGYLNEHQVLYVVDSGVQVTSHFGFTADFIFIQQWRYAPPSKPVEVTTLTGKEQISPGGAQNENPSRYRFLGWFLLAVDYQVFDELNLALGYYNLANTIGADGKRQNIFWDHESARFYLTATVGLDALYERFKGDDSGGDKTKLGGRIAKAPAWNGLTF